MAWCVILAPGLLPESSMESLSSFIRAHQEELTALWLERVRKLPHADQLPEPLLRDHVPVMIARIADAIERGDWSGASLSSLPSAHAEQRVQQGFDVRELVAEYRELRATIVRAYRGHIAALHAPLASALEPIEVMHHALDRAIADAVDSHEVERDRSREVFLGVLGHDLRNPLQSIAMTAEAMLLRSDASQGEMVKLAARVLSSTARMNRMIDQLLDVVRMRLGGGLVLEPTTVDLRPLVEQVVDEVTASNPGRRIESVTQKAGDFVGEWDGDRISQVLSNLVVNAVRHGEDPIVIEIIDAADSVVIEVRNNGHIAPELLGNIFDPFTSGTKNHRDGLGLGLFIVRMVVEAHGGDVVAKSNAEIGTRFTVRLPRNVPRAGTALAGKPS